MGLVVNITVGRLLARNEKLTTAKLNAIVKGIVIDVSGIIGTADLADGAVTSVKASPGAWFWANATYDGATTYSAVYAPVLSGYINGLVLAFKADAQNLGPSLFDAGAGAKPLKKHGGRLDVAPGDIVANGQVEVRYNTNLVAGGCWEVLSLPGRPVETMPFQGASAFMAGIAGVLPEPKAGQHGYYFRGDGNWINLVTQVNGLIAVANPYAEIFKQQNFI